MERSLSSSKGAAIFLAVAIACIALGSIFLRLLEDYSLFYRGLSKSDRARSAERATLRAYNWSRFYGGSWEDEFQQRAHELSNSPQYDRVDFFRAILLLCDLDGSKAMTFVEGLGDDASALRENLLRLKASSEFRKLTVKQQKKVKDWIDELGVVIQR